LAARGATSSLPEEDNSEVLTYREEDIVSSELSLDELTATGEAVCIGVEMWPELQRCLLCNFSCSFRGNLLKHLRLHGYEPKFCKLPREESQLDKELGARGCRKLFAAAAFDLHTCDARPPKYFGAERWSKASDDGEKIKSKRKKNLFKEEETGSSSSSSEDSDSDESEEESIQNPGLQLVEDLCGAGRPVCVGWEESSGEWSHCNLCAYGCPVRGNLYKHITAHGVTAFKFCSAPRDEASLSSLPEGVRGCRKIYAAATFHKHVCTAAEEERLGDFQLRSRVQKKKKKKRKEKQKQRFKFGVPDGSPAKFYSERYAKLFQQLEAKGEECGVSMDAMFMRNGKMELVYLTAWQMQAVREFAGGSDKYFLVREANWDDEISFY
jgi:hypothetical protein